jgi:exopolysaccharide biosynthesis polyprenyl glycosylphosphotransferase
VRLARYKIVLAVLDFVCLVLSFYLAFLLTGRGGELSFAQSGVDALYELAFISVYSFVLILLFQSNGLYKINIVISGSRQLVAIFVSFLYAVAGLAIVFFFVRASYTIDSRMIVGTFGGMGLLVIAFYRLVVFRTVYVYLNKREFIKKNIVIVGAHLEAKNFLIQLELDNIYGLNVVGFVDDTMKKDTTVFERYRNLGPVKNLPAIVREHRVKEILVTVSNVDHEGLMRILDYCKKSRARVTVTSSLFDIVHRKASSERYYNLPIARVNAYDPSRAVLVFKRLVDIVGSLLGLALMFIPLSVIALIIKVTSKGPVFYKQTRIGKDGREFNFYKFRSMLVGSDIDGTREKILRDFIKKGNHSNGGSSKVVDEKMVTPIGRVMRKTSIDELPQLFNVLKGDMSLVGPRPCLPYEYKAYDEWHKRRLSVLPGCTGLWQVSSRSQTGFDDMVLLDLYYIENISPWFDLQLMLKTVPVMVFGRGGK